MVEPGAKHWINLEGWRKGMDEFNFPSSGDLVGKELTLCYTGDLIVKYTFHDAYLVWEILDGLEKGQSHSERYEAIRVAANLYFVDFVRNDPPNVSISIALDLNTGTATVVTATAPDKEKASQSFLDRLGKQVDLSAFSVEISHPNVKEYATDKRAARHERTTELVGKRIKYRYGRNNVYEHIYLNPQLFTWHCLVGAEKGLGDTEFCDCFKFTPNIYLFIWREKVMPTFGLVLIDLKEMRSTGKTFGLDISSGKYVNFTMGSIAEIISETTHP